MSLRNYTIFVVLSTLVFLSGCSSTPTLPVISDTDAFKVERKLLSENKQVAAKYVKAMKDKKQKRIWIQPANKTEPCKVSTLYDVESGNYTLDSNFKMYWDGECENGYANGLGRTFQKGILIDAKILEIYQGKEEKPRHLVRTYDLTGTTLKGDFENGYWVDTSITDNNVEFNIIFNSGYFGDEEDFIAWAEISPFSDGKKYAKQYGNFRYIIYEDDYPVKFRFSIVDNDNNFLGYSVMKHEDGRIAHVEHPGLRKVSLPKSYLSRVSQIHLEIKEAVNKAISAAKQADEAVKQYTGKICKKSVSVDL